MTHQVKYVVKQKSTDGKITEEILNSRDQVSRWIEMVKQNGYKVISRRTLIVR